MVDMKTQQLTILMITLLVLQVFAVCTSLGGTSAQTKPSVYVGVDLSYGDVADVESIIDQVSSFTNLVVVGTTRITWYPDKLQQTFQYAYDKGLSFLSLPPATRRGQATEDWYANANSTFGNKLLGFYYLDEPGGKQLDRVNNYVYLNVTNSPSAYADAASQFVAGLSADVGSPEASKYSYKSFTSDYALYWFDYKAGYDTVFAEFGWNLSRQLNIALCRGAATSENKDWGAIMTWTYTNPPYIESADALYNDMVLAYNNGAKYIVVFDGNEGWTGGILTQEHLDALQRFWNYIQTNQPKSNPASSRTAFVLPNAYGYGFRGPQDHIWGLWEVDDLAYNLSVSVNSMLNQYGEKLDIIYPDGLQPGNNGYNQIINYDSYNPPPSTSPSPSATPLPPTPSPTATDTPSEPFPALVIATAIASAAIVSAAVFAYFKRYTYQRTLNAAFRR